VALLCDGTPKQKEHAEAALQQLKSRSSANRQAIKDLIHAHSLD
jgi:hypothetical protein